MDLIYTDAQLNDLGVLQGYTLDVDVASEMDFEIKVSITNTALAVGYYWYIEGTEYGGRIDCIKVDTENDEITYTGRTWRGILATKIVCPPTGEAYKVISGDWQLLVNDLIAEQGLEQLFAADPDSVFQVDDWQIDRYVTLLTAFTKMLAAEDYRISLEWRAGYVYIGATAIRDLTDTVQYETEDQVSLTVTDDQGGVNHLICLGQGELTKREVVHLYCTASGGITEEAQYYTGLDEIVEVYENTGAADRAALKQGGFDRLKSRKNAQTFSVNVEDLDVRIGDIVGGLERVTGIRVAATVTNIIFKIDAYGQPSIEYKVGEET